MGDSYLFNYLRPNICNVRSIFHPFVVVSRYRDPQLQIGENSTYLLPLGPNICNVRCLYTHFIPNISDLIGYFLNRLNTTIVVVGVKMVD